MKKLITLLFATLLTSSQLLTAQSEMSSFFTTGSGLSSTMLSDYQTAGINPANLGWSRDGRKFHLGFAELNGSVYSQPLTRADLFNFFNDDLDFTQMDKYEAVKNFTNARLIMDLSALAAGFSFQDEKIGGIAFHVRDRNLVNMKLNSLVADILWLGYNSDYFDEKIYDELGNIIEGISTNPQPITNLMKGTTFTQLWIREYGLSYGRQVLSNDAVQLYLGAGVKLLNGIGIIEITTDNDELRAYSALSPGFDFDYPQPSPSRVTGSGFSPVGSGTAFDLGATLDLYDKVRVSMAVNDIGSITWDGNVYEASYSASISRIETAGLGTESINKIFDAIAVKDDIFEWNGLTERETRLPTSWRAGATYSGLGRWTLGIDFMAPMEKRPGSYEQTVWGIGAHYNPYGKFNLTAGIGGGGNTGFRVPLGLSFEILPGWEAGIATRDITTLVRNKDPYMSVALGFLRFGFGSFTRTVAANSME
ncbi:MAG: DUF5723 family protein [Bacteroidales bacterium]|nr:DUF5723 family protein [Bacteroidales bacterium]MDD3664965.1 DUF5723 family protein [Bacteroidales bacterium]